LNVFDVSVTSLPSGYSSELPYQVESEIQVRCDLAHDRKLETQDV